jgi:hypothetical protein
MKRTILSLVLAFAAVAASAQSTFQASLSGLNEVSPNGSPGIGFGTVVLNLAKDQITVNLSFSGLLAPATVSHIHGPAPAGINAGAIFPLSGVPNATSGVLPEQVFAITPTQVGYLEAGNLYFNIHTSVFPGGEIRGQLALVPEPSSLTLAGLGLLGAAWQLRRRGRG